MAYLEGSAGVVIDYCDLVLTASDYPDYFPQDFELDYNPETKILMVDYSLPSPGNIPTVKEVRYVQNRDEFVEQHLSRSQQIKLYDDLLYQITLRTIHELFEADVIAAIAMIVFNGWVTSIDKGTGNEVTSCVLSVPAHREQFMAINLANIEPKACFRALKGVGSSTLHSITPIPPIMKIEREDHRFVASHEVANTLDESVNLASIEWEDFEHLIRELFEEEFSSSGGEVKVTQASRDGGVDAIAFDPDPIRGGKIIIQAKRYTNTVGVSAVRDLFGTVMNEGANKGILVTTSNYGPDAYAFANGKPLVLLNGANLLHLLEKHGHKAHIDLQQARNINAPQ
jgi:restriction system protein